MWWAVCVCWGGVITERSWCTWVIDSGVDEIANTAPTSTSRHELVVGGGPWLLQVLRPCICAVQREDDSSCALHNRQSLLDEVCWGPNVSQCSSKQPLDGIKVALPEACSPAAVGRTRRERWAEVGAAGWPAGSNAVCACVAAGATH